MGKVLIEPIFLSKSVRVKSLNVPLLNATVIIKLAPNIANHYSSDAIMDLIQYNEL